MHIVNKAKDLLKKFQSGNLSLSDFKELVSTVNDSSDQELEDFFFEEWNKFDTYPSLSQEKIDSLYCHLDLTFLQNNTALGTNCSLNSFAFCKWINHTVLHTTPRVANIG